MRTLLAFLWLALPLGAQAPYLVKDINTTYSTDRASSDPAAFTAHGDRVYFVATTKAAGTELWSTGGTGASIVADIIPGQAGSGPAALRAGLAPLLFNARDVDHGVELWATDGTAAGTRILVDINPGPNSSDPSTGIFDRNRWLFSADNGTNGRELWITDGTAAGTRMLVDIEPGPASSSPRAFVAMGDRVYFLTGTALWKTDGTESGTVKVAAVAARNLTAAGNRLFFEAFTVPTGSELWVSDGTETGTRMLPEILPGNAPAFTPQYPFSTFTALGSRVLFVANDGQHGREPWISDGTDAGTHMLLDMTAGSTGTFDSRAFNAAVLGNRVYFSGEDAGHGHELWSTDGTSAGTTLFFDVLPGTESSGAVPLGTANGKVFFLTFGASPKLWVTDGTTNGTRALTANGGSFDVHGSARVTGDRLYFGGETPLTGEEPWVSDGTDAGTRMIANIAADGAPSASPRMLAATNGLLFFHATEGLLSPSSNIAEASLWRSDGTANGTFKLMETGQHPPELTAAGNYVFFDDPSYLNGTLMSDGTIAGTESAEKFRHRFGDAEIKALHPFGDTLFVAAGDNFDTTLWKTTPAPYMPATLLGSHNPYGLVEVAGRYMFYAAAQKSIHDRGLWLTDGTPAGTYAVVPDLGADYDGVSRLASAAGLAFFVMRREDENVAKLWKSDGTLDGTVAIKEIPFGGSQVEIDSTGKRIFFLTSDALWTSDGTEAGTIELAKTKLLSLGYDADLMKAVGDRVVFTQYNAETGASTLWGSDGTPAGTKALMPVTSLVASIDGAAYFAGSDDAHGSELWTSDGTPDGTRLLFDVEAGPASSSPSEFTKMGDAIYFSASTEGTGTGAELWALPLTVSRASVRDAHAAEHAQTLRFTATLSRASQTAVTMSFATSDGTAHAGQDYEAASGTVTFAPGALTKTIDIRLLGDTTPENNETFALTLSNGASATGVIEDDDQAADLALETAFAGSSFDLSDSVRVTNHGPRGATDVEVEITSVPPLSQPCWVCSIPQIASGASDVAGVPNPFGTQAWLTATVHARQHDPDPSNNAVSWTVGAFDDFALDTAFVTPGQTAHGFAKIKSYGPPPTPASTDESVVSISSPVTNADGMATFAVTAHKPGTVTLTVGANHSKLVVSVVPAGTTPRWPNALQFTFDFTVTSVQEPVRLTIKRIGIAPLTGARPTGDVVVVANGQQLARVTITGRDEVVVPLFFPWLGSVQYQIQYAGDASFLPIAENASVFVRPGTPAITGQLQPIPGQANAYQLNVRVGGAPGAAPTGTVQIFRGATSLGTLALTPSPSGMSTAAMNIANLPGDEVSVLVHYSGNSLYEAKSQEIRFVAPRRRNVRH